MKTTSTVVDQLREWCATEERILSRALESTRELCERLNRVLENLEPDPPPFALLLSRVLNEDGAPDLVVLRPRCVLPESHDQ